MAPRILSAGREARLVRKMTFTPGGDAKAIADIATRHFGSYETMFKRHGWPERGSEMMRKVQTRVADTYGSVRGFEAHFAAGHPPKET